MYESFMARIKQTPGTSSGGQAPRKDFKNIRNLEVTRRYRYKPGTASLREIRKSQKSTDLLFPKSAFQRLVRECPPLSPPLLRLFTDSRHSSVFQVSHPVPEHSYRGSTGKCRVLSCKFIRRSQPLCYSCQARNHSTGTLNRWRSKLI